MAAPHLTGSNLLAAAKAASSTKPSRAPTGCTSIDQALDGGFDYSTITSLAGTNQADKTLIAMHAIVGHLFSGANTDVAFIYTTESSFPVQMHETIVHRLRSGPGENLTDEEVQGKINGMLERVKLMRVFDLIGIMESVGEISEAWGLAEREKEATINRARRKKGEIPSNQADEDEDLLDSGDETELESVMATEHKGIGMIVIDTLASALGGEMSKNQNEGLALMTSFFSSLRSITVHYQICTIVVNSWVMPNSAYKPSGRRPEESVSNFPSTQGKPGLGQTYAHLIDLSLFLSDMPRSREDAEIAFAGLAGPNLRFATAKVLEVLADRHSCREGRWGVFERDGVVMAPYD